MSETYPKAPHRTSQTLLLPECQNPVAALAIAPVGQMPILDTMAPAEGVSRQKRQNTSSAQAGGYTSITTGEIVQSKSYLVVRRRRTFPQGQILKWRVHGLGYFQSCRSADAFNRAVR